MKKEHKIRPIHPFAARMAPEIAFDALDGLKKGATVLDPMAGSGTVLRTISELGYNGIGFDIDPLAILMSKAWTTKVVEKTLLKKAEAILNTAMETKANSIKLPWIDNDESTKKFIKFWFAPKQINDLRKLSFVINKEKGIYSSVLKIALSRLIITKTKGASLAADVSHSRPHKVRDTNDFDVFYEFRIACTRIAKILSEENPKGKVKVERGDARNLLKVKDESVDFIITSPPYLNALDYMRGHKLALVWLGHKIDDLAIIRGKSVGAEKAPDDSSNINLAEELTKGIRSINRLPKNKISMIYRYALDMDRLLKESSRVLKKGCNATFVVGNSCIMGIYIKNTSIVTEAAKRSGFVVVEHKERKIPESRRYLPPPSKKEESVLSKRMRTEAVITFTKK